MNKLTDYFTKYQQWAVTHRRLYLGVIFLLIAVTIAALLLANVSLTPDILLLILLVVAALMGQALVFLRDWIPFIALLLAYESLRGLADNLGVRAHTEDLIAVERWLFGGIIPTLWLQEVLYQGRAQWWDVLGMIVYFMHFVTPLVIGFWLWLTRRSYYWLFVICLTILCFSGFITYILFPATPPWLAAKQGDLDPVVKIIDASLQLFPGSMHISSFYHQLNPNPVAAMPSLHAAFPALMLLILLKAVGRKGWWFFPYCAAVWFYIVYLGEHYVIDAVAGIAYAAAAVWLGTKLWQRLMKTRWMQQLAGQPLGSADPMDTTARGQLSDLAE